MNREPNPNTERIMDKRALTGCLLGAAAIGTEIVFDNPVATCVAVGLGAIGAVSYFKGRVYRRPNR
jgi:hypothetical protein